MGRYDKIKVYYNSSWHTPNQIKVYKEGTGWVDLGTADSDSTKRIEVLNANGYRWQRVTLNKQTNWVQDGEPYTTGMFNLLPVTGYNFDPRRNDFYMDVTIRKTASGHQQVFISGTNHGSNDESFFIVTWLNDGRIQVKSHERGGNTYTLETDNAVADNQWTRLIISQPKSNSTVMSVTFNGQTKTGTMYGRWSDSWSYNNVGAGAIQFTGYFRIQGTETNDFGSYWAHNCEFSINRNTPTPSNGSTYTNLSINTNGHWDVQWV